MDVAFLKKSKIVRFKIWNVSSKTQCRLVSDTSHPGPGTQQTDRMTDIKRRKVSFRMLARPSELSTSRARTSFLGSEFRGCPNFNAPAQPIKMTGGGQVCLCVFFIVLCNVPWAQCTSITYTLAHHYHFYFSPSSFAIDLLLTCLALH
jgi:hypothetical protein